MAIEMEQKATIERHLQTIMLSIITAGLIAAFSFLWNINGAIIAMRVEMQFKNEEIQKVSRAILEMQADIKNLDKRLQGVENMEKLK